VTESKINNITSRVIAFVADREARWASEEHVQVKGVDRARVEAAVTKFFADNQPTASETVEDLANWFILCQTSYAQYLND
jgi:hypothetical protein